MYAFLSKVRPNPNNIFCYVLGFFFFFPENSCHLGKYMVTLLIKNAKIVFFKGRLKKEVASINKTNLSL